MKSVTFSFISSAIKYLPLKSRAPFCSPAPRCSLPYERRFSGAVLRSPEATSPSHAGESQEGISDLHVTCHCLAGGLSTYAQDGLCWGRWRRERRGRRGSRPVLTRLQGIRGGAEGLSEPLAGGAGVPWGRHHLKDATVGGNSKSPPLIYAVSVLFSKAQDFGHTWHGTGRPTLLLLLCVPRQGCVSPDRAVCL